MTPEEQAYWAVSDALCKTRHPENQLTYEEALVKVREIIAAVVAAERERCAKIADDQAYVELCADDTRAGLVRAMPYQKVAKLIREGSKHGKATP